MSHEALKKKLEGRQHSHNGQHNDFLLIVNHY